MTTNYSTSQDELKIYLKQLLHEIFDSVIDNQETDLVDLLQGESNGNEGEAYYSEMHMITQSENLVSMMSEQKCEDIIMAEPSSVSDLIIRVSSCSRIRDCSKEIQKEVESLKKAEVYNRSLSIRSPLNQSSVLIEVYEEPSEQELSYHDFNLTNDYLAISKSQPAQALAKFNLSQKEEEEAANDKSDVAEDQISVERNGSIIEVKSYQVSALSLYVQELSLSCSQEHSQYQRQYAAEELKEKQSEVQQSYSKMISYVLDKKEGQKSRDVHKFLKNLEKVSNGGIMDGMQAISLESEKKSKDLFRACQDSASLNDHHNAYLPLKNQSSKDTSNKEEDDHSQQLLRPNSNATSNVQTEDQHPIVPQPEDEDQLDIPNEGNIQELQDSSLLPSSHHSQHEVEELKSPITYNNQENSDNSHLLLYTEQESKDVAVSSKARISILDDHVVDDEEIKLTLSSPEQIASRIIRRGPQHIAPGSPHLCRFSASQTNQSQPPIVQDTIKEEDYSRQPLPQRGTIVQPGSHLTNFLQKVGQENQKLHEKRRLNVNSRQSVIVQPRRKLDPNAGNKENIRPLLESIKEKSTLPKMAQLKATHKPTKHIEHPVAIGKKQRFEGRFPHAANTMIVEKRLPPVTIYSKKLTNKVSAAQDSCSLCNVKFRVYDVQVVMKCKHKGHQKCVENLLKSQGHSDHPSSALIGSRLQLPKEKLTLQQRALNHECRQYCNELLD